VVEIINPNSRPCDRRDKIEMIAIGIDAGVASTGYGIVTDESGTLVKCDCSVETDALALAICHLHSYKMNRLYQRIHR